MKQAVIDLVGGEITEATSRLAKEEEMLKAEMAELAGKRALFDQEVSRINDLQEFLDSWVLFKEHG